MQAQCSLGIGVEDIDAHSREAWFGNAILSRQKPIEKPLSVADKSSHRCLTDTETLSRLLARAVWRCKSLEAFGVEVIISRGHPRLNPAPEPPLRR